MREFMSTTAASVYVMQRRKDADALVESKLKVPNAWDFGYARVLFLENHVVRIVNRQGHTLTEGVRPSLNQVYAFLLRSFW